MPYFLDGKCVRKGTKEDPGETVKCHDTRDEALAHLRALYVHVEDVLKETFAPRPTVGDILESKIHKSFTVTADTLYALGYIGRDERIRLSGGIGDSLGMLDEVVDELGLAQRSVDPNIAIILGTLGGVGRGVFSAYKDMGTGQDRWLAVSTAEEWDKQDEMFTTKAMDWDIARAVRTSDYPELRLWHVRGFKLGVADSMRRVGKWAVDEGWWYDNPFAQSVKDLVERNQGKWKVSRGFFTVEAAGQCRECGVGLTVGLLNYVLGVVCPTCKTYYPKPNYLSGLRVLKSETFDITVTDVPAVGSTAITAWTNNKE